MIPTNSLTSRLFNEFSAGYDLKLQEIVHDELARTFGRNLGDSASSVPDLVPLAPRTPKKFLEKVGYCFCVWLSNPPVPDTGYSDLL